MGKYPINREYFPYNHLYPPFKSGEFAGFIGTFMKTPKSILRDREISVTREYISGYKNGDIEIIIYQPHGLPSDEEESCPCLVYFHGGAFVFGASFHHYIMAKEYAMKTPCKLIFVQYRLSPMYRFPIPVEDCYLGYLWTLQNAKRLKIDENRVGVGGDSAGGALAAAVCRMALDRGQIVPRLQMLIYPVLDRRLETESQKNFTDTPMWNSKLSVKMWDAYIGKKLRGELSYASPSEATSFEGLPTAYIETAEFDCLRDEGIIYAQKLSEAGVQVELNQTKGTMHGFDAARNKEVPKLAIKTRVEFMQRYFCVNGGLEGANGKEHEEQK